MSTLQDVHDDDPNGSGAEAASGTEGVREDPHEIVWWRHDWNEPVGFIKNIRILRCVTPVIPGHEVVWDRLDIDEMRLGHKAAMLVLQGMGLTTMLVPNSALRGATIPFGSPVAHLVLNRDDWAPYSSPPKLTGLVMAKLIATPDAPEDKILQALVAAVLANP
jgi:hypothetical protein